MNNPNKFVISDVLKGLVTIATINLEDYPFLEEYVEMLEKNETDEICFTENGKPIAYLSLTPEYKRMFSVNDDQY